MGILVVVAAGCYTFGNHRTKAVSPRGLAEAYFFSPLKKKRPPGLLSSHVPEQIKTLTSFWGHHGWLGMQPTIPAVSGAHFGSTTAYEKIPRRTHSEVTVSALAPEQGTSEGFPTKCYTFSLFQSPVWLMRLPATESRGARFPNNTTACNGAVLLITVALTSSAQRDAFRRYCVSKAGSPPRSSRA